MSSCHQRQKNINKRKTPEIIRGDNPCCKERCVSFRVEGKDSICTSSKSGKLSVGISLGYHFTA
jgi:hypothetical protein